MALFGLTDVKISGESNNGTLGDFEINPYEAGGRDNTTIYRYPSELGSSEIPHHMLFTIYAQEYNQRESGIQKAIGDPSDNDTGNSTSRMRTKPRS